MGKAQWPLAEAERIASAIIADLLPVCTRIQVAGSVRRRKELVGDIELVAIPCYEPAGLFGDREQSALWAHLHGRDTYRFTKGDHPQGRYHQLALPAYGGLQLDLFLAQPRIGASRSSCGRAARSLVRVSWRAGSGCRGLAARNRGAWTGGW